MTDQVAVEDLRIRYELPRDAPVRPCLLNNGLTVPSPVVVAAELPGWPDMSLQLAVEGGKLVLTRLELVRSDSQVPLSQAAVRDLPLTAITKEVRRRIVAAFSVLDQLGGGDGTAARIAALPGAGRTADESAARGPSRRRAVDETLLGQVAAIVTAHPARPTRAVQEQLGTSHRNATRWIAAARRHGVLAEAPAGGAS